MTADAYQGYNIRALFRTGYQSYYAAGYLYRLSGYFKEKINEFRRMT